jgi:hypothetical protein
VGNCADGRKSDANNDISDLIWEKTTAEKAALVEQLEAYQLKLRKKNKDELDQIQTIDLKKVKWEDCAQGGAKCNLSVCESGRRGDKGSSKAGIEEFGGSFRGVQAMAEFVTQW